jgi:hypothetical protein
MIVIFPLDIFYSHSLRTAAVQQTNFFYVIKELKGLRNLAKSLFSQKIEGGNFCMACIFGKSSFSSTK